jgi:hypothetical protein
VNRHANNVCDISHVGEDVVAWMCQAQHQCEKIVLGSKGWKVMMWSHMHACAKMQATESDVKDS